MSSSLNSNLHQAPTLPKPVQLFSVPQPSKDPKPPFSYVYPQNPACTPSALHPDPKPPYKYPPTNPSPLSSPIVTTTMKPITITLFLLIALVASAAAFTSEEDASESTCTREMYRHPLDKYCRSFMMHGRRGGSQGEIMMVDEEDEDNEGAPKECCNQLRMMKEECRCPAVRHMMREIMQQEGKGSAEEYCRGRRCGEMMTRGRFLPAMCGMQPRTCRMGQSGTAD